MKLQCLNCYHEFDGGISLDELGWHSVCPECGSSFDVDVPKGRIIMVFTDPDDDVAEDEDPYYTFTDNFTGQNVNVYFAFDTVEEFLTAWKQIAYGKDGPFGMWYWVLDNGHLVCSGACDTGDIDIFKDYWEISD